MEAAQELRRVPAQHQLQPLLVNRNSFRVTYRMSLAVNVTYVRVSAWTVRLEAARV